MEAGQGLEWDLALRRAWHTLAAITVLLLTQVILSGLLWLGVHVLGLESMQHVKTIYRIVQICAF